MAHLTGLKLDCRLRIHQLVQLRAGSAASSQSRAITRAVPETAKKFMSADEWGYWYEGKPAAVDIKDPYGKVMEKAGRGRAMAARSRTAWATSPAGTR